MCACRTYDASRELFVQLCAQCAVDVSPWQVGVVCGMDRLGSTSSSSLSCDCHTFSSYLDLVLVGGARPHLLCQCSLREHSGVLLVVLEAVLSEGVEQARCVVNSAAEKINRNILLHLLLPPPSPPPPPPSSTGLPQCLTNLPSSVWSDCALREGEAWLRREH